MVKLWILFDFHKANLNMSDNSYVLRCAWLIRIGQPPKANQRLTIIDGILREVVNIPADELPRLQPVAVLPGLVNAHTHLEFSDLPEALEPPDPFPDWIRSVVQYRRADLETDESIRHAVESGVAECQASGTAILGEICTSDAGRNALLSATTQAQKQIPINAVCFRELLGFTSNRVPQLQNLADRFVDGFPDQHSGNDRIIPGLSPHAPYSVHPAVVQHTSAISNRHNVPVAMHLAETTDEVEFIESKSGRFVDFLDRIGLWQPESLNDIHSITDYLRILKNCSLALAIHGNYFSQADVKLLGKAANITTVYCVRTHRWFGHRNHPWKQIEAAGGTVILGTDSRASNPDLSIWKELQTFCQLHPEESLLARLPMISTASAAAIGLDPTIVNLKIDAPYRGTIINTDATTESALDDSLKHESSQVLTLPAVASPS